ncbi:hypothetical protein NMY22_g12533 [Coprinellus aureogranulatus]|nr:hypothetical protein NMY22_g12533 [Coprinellus aureogranulatus]
MDCFDEEGGSSLGPGSHFLPGLIRPEREPYEHPRRVQYACSTCGKSYAAPQHLSIHERDCDGNKRKVDGMLEESRLFWEMRKKRRLERLAGEASRLHPPDNEGINDTTEPDPSGRSEGQTDDGVGPALEPSMDRKPERNTRRPKRYDEDATPSLARATRRARNPLGSSEAVARVDLQVSHAGYATANPVAIPSPGGPSPPHVPTPGGTPHIPAAHNMEPIQRVMEAEQAIDESLDVPVAHRRGRRDIQRPTRFRQEGTPPPATLDRPAEDAEQQCADASAEGDSGNSTREGEPQPGGSETHEANAVGTSNLTPPVAGHQRMCENAALPHSAARLLVIHRSVRNIFGVTRIYEVPSEHSITHDPFRLLALRDSDDAPVDKGDLNDPSAAQTVDATGLPAMQSEPGPSDSSGKNADPIGLAKETGPGSKKDMPKPSIYGPFKNRTAFSLADWYWNSTNKSFFDFRKLIAIMKEPSFSVGDATTINWKTAFDALGANYCDLPNPHEAAWITDDGWTSTPIVIDVPFHKLMKDNKGATMSYRVGNLRHRRILSVIKEKILNRKDSEQFHYIPFRPMWKPTEESVEVELYGEMYASRAFMAAHEELQKLPCTEADRDYERVVVALMFWSDSVQLTTFANASLWPCCLFFGNESKYRRCQPSEAFRNSDSDVNPQQGSLLVGPRPRLDRHDRLCLTVDDAPRAVIQVPMTPSRRPKTSHSLLPVSFSRGTQRLGAESRGYQEA